MSRTEVGLICLILNEGISTKVGFLYTRAGKLNSH